jgi:hypothetical protein
LFPFQLITKIYKFTVFDLNLIIFYSICVLETKYLSPHFLDQPIKHGRHCGVNESHPPAVEFWALLSGQGGGWGEEGMGLFLGAVNF